MEHLFRSTETTKRFFPFRCTEPTQSASSPSSFDVSVAGHHLFHFEFGDENEIQVQVIIHYLDDFGYIRVNGSWELLPNLNCTV